MAQAKHVHPRGSLHQESEADALLVITVVFTCTARSWANRGPHRSDVRVRAVVAKRQ